MADAAGSVGPTMPSSAQLRRSAVRRRNRRRALAGSVVLVAAAAVAVAGSTLLGPRTASIGPATQAPVRTESTTAPTSEPVPSPTLPGPGATTDFTATDGPPALERTQARAFVEGLRFEDEAEWSASPDFVPTVVTDVTPVQVLGCEPGAVDAPGVLAMRTVTKPGAESGSVRQLSVFADAPAAARAFEEVRAVMAACHARDSGVVAGTEAEGAQRIERSFVGGQLALGDESFWVATKDLVTSEGGPFAVGDELFYSTASLLVLDGNVVTVIDDPAFGDELRATFVQDAGAECSCSRGTSPCGAER